MCACVYIYIYIITTECTTNFGEHGGPTDQGGTAHQSAGHVGNFASNTATYSLPAALREIVWTPHIFQWQANAWCLASAAAAVVVVSGGSLHSRSASAVVPGQTFRSQLKASTDSPHIETLPPRSNARRCGCASQSRWASSHGRTLYTVAKSGCLSKYQPSYAIERTTGVPTSSSGAAACVVKVRSVRNVARQHTVAGVGGVGGGGDIRGMV